MEPVGLFWTYRVMRTIKLAGDNRVSNEATLYRH